METILTTLGILASFFFGYKLCKLKENLKDVQDELETLHNIRSIDTLNDDDISKLHDKYE